MYPHKSLWCDTGEHISSTASLRDSTVSGLQKVAQMHRAGLLFMLTLISLRCQGRKLQPKGTGVETLAYSGIFDLGLESSKSGCIVLSQVQELLLVLMLCPRPESVLTAIREWPWQDGRCRRPAGVKAPGAGPAHRSPCKQERAAAQMSSQVWHQVQSMVPLAPTYTIVLSGEYAGLLHRCVCL